MAEVGSGIYAIASGDRAYIGSANHIGKRWEQHQQKLSSGKHSSYLLQQEFDRVGLRGLKLKILERCSREQLEERER